MLIYDFLYLLIRCHGNRNQIFFLQGNQQNQRKMVFFVFKFNVSWMKLLVAQRHFYMDKTTTNVDVVSGKNNLIGILY